MVQEPRTISKHRDSIRAKKPTNNFHIKSKLPIRIPKRNVNGKTISSR